MACHTLAYKASLMLVLHEDPYHSYLALAALSMNEESLESLRQAEGDTAGSTLPKLDLLPLDPVWNVSKETRAYFEEVMKSL